MSEAVLWGAVLRICQALLQAAPFLLIGFVVTAVFRCWLGPHGVRTLFGEGTWRHRKYGWLIGMFLPVGIGLLLPVCSLGVIPIMREMHRMKLATGTILAFGLAAPLFNPLSILYGLTLSEPWIILTFSFCAMLIASCVGIVFDRLFPHDTTVLAESPLPAYGIRRIIATFIEMGREFWSRSSLYILIGLSGVVLLNFLLPKGAFQSSVNGDNPWAPILMSGVAIPVYATPMLAVSQLGMMFQHGNSVGAAFALLILGAGINLGIIAWTIIALDWKKSLCWLGILFVTVLGIGYGIEKPLYPVDIEPANHTHAFDIYCCPFDLNQTNLTSAVWQKLKDDVRPEELFALWTLCSMGVLGLVAFGINTRFDLNRWLTAQPSPSEHRKTHFDIVLPRWALAVAVVGILLFFSGTMCYAYYPSPKECLEEIFIIKGEVLSAARSGDKDHALYWLPLWEDWNRRLQVGVYLRQGHLSEFHRMKSMIVRNELEMLEHALEDEDLAAILKHSLSLNNAQLRLTKAYRDELP